MQIPKLQAKLTDAAGTAPTLTWAWALLPSGLMVALAALFVPRAPHEASLPPFEMTQRQPGGGTLAAGETMVVGYSPGSPHVVWGRLQPGRNTAAQSPLAGQVSRLLVKTGQRVNVGDRILDLSTGPESRKATRAEKAQNIAEAAQVGAAGKQEQLQRKIQVAEGKLRDSQVRVAAAQQRVAEARRMVQQVRQNPDAPLAGVTPAGGPDRAALHRAQTAQRAANRAAARAAEAKQEAEAAQQQSASAAHEAASAVSAGDKVQEKFDAGEAKGSDVAAARATVVETERDAAKAARVAAAAHGRWETLQTAAVAAAKASDEAIAAIHGEAGRLQLFARNSDNQEKHSSSVGEAVRMAHEAVAESDAAISEAARLKSQIDGYQRQVISTKNALNSTSTELQAAQQKVLDKTISGHLSQVRAPASGVVVWVAPLAQDVAPGEALVRIGRMDLLDARLADSSNSWKALQPGQLLPVLVREAEPVAPPSTGTAIVPTARAVVRAAPASAAATAIAAAPPRGGRTAARLQRVEAPAAPGQPAILHVTIFNPPNPGQPGRVFHAGMTVLCYLTQPGVPQPAAQPVVIPASAVLPGAAGDATVAVLRPVAARGPLPPTGAPTPVATASPSEFRVEWRRVVLGQPRPGGREVKAGLRQGERISLRPADLMLYTEAHGGSATVRLLTLS